MNQAFNCFFLHSDDKLVMEQALIDLHVKPPIFFLTDWNSSHTGIILSTSTAGSSFVAYFLDAVTHEFL